MKHQSSISQNKINMVSVFTLVIAMQAALAKNHTPNIHNSITRLCELKEE
jgi:hypothetical protein